MSEIESFGDMCCYEDSSGFENAPFKRKTDNIAMKTLRKRGKKQGERMKSEWCCLRSFMKGEKKPGTKRERTDSE